MNISSRQAGRYNPHADREQEREQAAALGLPWHLRGDSTMDHFLGQWKRKDGAPVVHAHVPRECKLRGDHRLFHTCTHARMRIHHASRCVCVTSSCTGTFRSGGGSNREEYVVWRMSGQDAFFHPKTPGGALASICTAPHIRMHMYFLQR